MSGNVQSFPKLTIYTNEAPGGHVSAYFNPKEVSFTKSVSWSDDNQGEATNFPSLQFTAGQSITCSVDLYFDEYESGGSVRPSVEKLLSFCLKYSQDDGERPPKVKLKWGSNEVLAGTSFDEGVIESVQVKYTMFREDGTPCRGTATVALKQATGFDTLNGNPGSFSISSAAEAMNADARAYLEEKYGPIEEIDFSKTGPIEYRKD
jgi:hypothetical protein